jgi:hypothetical protein
MVPAPPSPPAVALARRVLGCSNCL